MGMSIDEIIKKENEIAAELQKTVDTHIVNDDGFTVEEMYCDDSEAIDDHLSRCKILVDYHKQIADVMCKYQKIAEIADEWKRDHDNLNYADDSYYWNKVREVLDNGNDN